MQAHELRAGDEYRDVDGTVQMTVILDPKADGDSPVTGKPQVVVAVRYRDGGANLRWFDRDAEVSYTRPE